MFEVISWSLRCGKTFAGLCDVLRPVEGQMFRNYNILHMYESEELQ